MRIERIIKGKFQSNRKMIIAALGFLFYATVLFYLFILNHNTSISVENLYAKVILFWIPTLGAVFPIVFATITTLGYSTSVEAKREKDTKYYWIFSYIKIAPPVGIAMIVATLFTNGALLDFITYITQYLIRS